MLHPDVNIERRLYHSHKRKSFCDPSGGVVKNYAGKATESWCTAIKNTGDKLQFWAENLTLQEKGCHLILQSFEAVSQHNIERTLAQNKNKTITNKQKIHLSRDQGSAHGQTKHGRVGNSLLKHFQFSAKVALSACCTLLTIHTIYRFFSSLGALSCNSQNNVKEEAIFNAHWFV